jgi:hypothetical protein
LETTCGGLLCLSAKERHILISKFDIKPDWSPTPANSNALPNPLRRYIHDLKTICDPAGDVAEMFRLRVENKLLRWECERLAAKAGEGRTASSASPSAASDRPGRLRPSSPCDDGRQRANDPCRPATSGTCLSYGGRSACRPEGMRVRGMGDLL